MFRRKTPEEKIAAIVRAEFAKTIVSLERDHRDYRRRLRLKEETRAALDDAEAKARRLYSERIALKKRFWEAYYEHDEAVLSEIEYQHELLDRAAKKAEKSLRKARANFERADFDEIAEGFALRAKADIAEDEINRRVGVLEKALEDLLAGVRQEIEETGQALREEYKVPRFEAAEEQDAHVRRMIAILDAVTESYTLGK